MIGLGSPFGVDRMGWQAVERLKADPPPDTECLCLDRPGAGLLPHLAGADEVVLVDAMIRPVGAKQRAGEVLELDRKQLQPDQARLSGHQLNLAETLALAEGLGMLPTRLRVLAILVNDEVIDPPDLSGYL